MALSKEATIRLQYLKGFGELMMVHNAKFVMGLALCPDGKVDMVLAVETMEISEIEYAINTFLETWMSEGRAEKLQEYKDRNKQ